MQGICETIPALPATKFVYDFDEPSDGGRQLLGGKGVGLAEMTQLGVPVPAGFTITTDACRAYMSSGKTLPEGLEGEVDHHQAALEERMAKLPEYDAEVRKALEMKPHTVEVVPAK